MTTPSQKPTAVQLAKDIQARHATRVREICGRRFVGNGDQQQAARNDALRESERQAERELRFLNGDRQ